jgi:AraC-like DNA-binding protein
VIVICYLSSQHLAQVHRAFPPPHSVTNASAWQAVVGALQLRRCDAAIVDPCAGGDHLAAERLAALERVLVVGSAFPVVGYLSVSAAGLRATQALARLGASEIVIRGVDDSTEAIAASVSRVVAASDARRVVSGFAPRLASLPSGIGTAVQMAFSRPDRLRSVGDLALAARTTRRSLDRWLARAGLPSARTLLSCARANAAYHLLAGGRVRASEAACLVGYTSPRSLSRELQAIAGQPASAIPLRLSRDAFAAAIERRLARDAREPSNSSY